MMIFFKTAITGIGATLVMDLWSLYKIPAQSTAAKLCAGWALDFMVAQRKVLASYDCLNAANTREMFTGWVFHYLIGVIFAFVPLMLSATVWLSEPSLNIGILAGLSTLFAPFMILQPAFGFGIAASRTPRPWLARLLSLLTHLAYGEGCISRP